MSEAKLPPILVVDDNHDNAEIIRQYLEIRGYPITVAHDGDEALAKFETVRPALTRWFIGRKLAEAMDTYFQSVRARVTLVVIRRR